MYCPWDVIKHTKKLLTDPRAEPEAYWINTSGNDLVKRFINKADKTTQNEIERLIAGGAIKKIRLGLTCHELNSSKYTLLWLDADLQVSIPKDGVR